MGKLHQDLYQIPDNELTQASADAYDDQKQAETIMDLDWKTPEIMEKDANCKFFRGSNQRCVTH